MKCEHCGGDVVWKGSLVGGYLFCENCDGLMAPPTYHESDQYVVSPAKESSITIVVVGGGGGSGGKGVITAGGGSGGSDGNPLRCPNKCCMNGGSAYCDCYGEPGV